MLAYDVSLDDVLQRMHYIANHNLLVENNTPNITIALFKELVELDHDVHHLVKGRFIVAQIQSNVFRHALALIDLQAIHNVNLFHIKININLSKNITLCILDLDLNNFFIRMK